MLLQSLSHRLGMGFPRARAAFDIGKQERHVAGRKLPLMFNCKMWNPRSFARTRFGRNGVVAGGKGINASRIRRLGRDTIAR